MIYHNILFPVLGFDRVATRVYENADITVVVNKNDKYCNFYHKYNASSGTATHKIYGIKLRGKPFALMKKIGKFYELCGYRDFSKSELLYLIKQYYKEERTN